MDLDPVGMQSTGLLGYYYVEALGHYFTYFWGSGNDEDHGATAIFSRLHLRYLYIYIHIISRYISLAFRGLALLGALAR